MAKIVLTDARIRALRPRRTAYDIRDGKLGGFGTRVLPSGRRRFFVHSQHRGERVWKILGDAATMSVDEARSSAVRTLAAIRRGEDPPRDPDETIFEAVAETVFDRYARLWNPAQPDVERRHPLALHREQWEFAELRHDVLVEQPPDAFRRGRLAAHRDMLLHVARRQGRPPSARPRAGPATAPEPGPRPP